VPPRDSAEVDAFVRTLREHARNGYTFATPDSPEAYFLTGLRNPTRTMYEFLGDSGGHTDRILAIPEARRVTAVAISYWTIFSLRPDPRLLAALRARYPDSAAVWHFMVRWNDAHRAAWGRGLVHPRTPRLALRRTMRRSVAIPVHNEEAVLPELLTRLRAVLDGLPGGLHEMI